MFLLSLGLFLLLFNMNIKISMKRGYVCSDIIFLAFNWGFVLFLQLHVYLTVDDLVGNEKK
jgi:hypothetical protein